MKVTLSDWAREIGVSRQTAIKWEEQKRITVERPCKRTVLIEKDTKRPRPFKPWEIKNGSLR